MNDVDAALEELKYAVARLVQDHRGVVVGASRTGDGSRECLVLTVEPAGAPCRRLRIHSTDLAEPMYRYAWLWSAYRAVDERDNTDGRNFGDLQRTLDVIKHWIIDGMPWREVPELSRPPDV